MKWSLQVALVFFAMGMLCASALCAEEQSPLALVLQVDRSEIFPAEPFYVDVRVKNVSPAPLLAGQYWGSVEIFVAAENQEYGPAFYTGDRGRHFGGQVKLEPGGAHSRILLLFVDYARGQETLLFPRAGTYRLKMRIDSGLPGTPTLESPEVKIVVKELPAEEVEPHRLIAESAPARRAIRIGGSIEGTLQALVDKFPRSIYADHVRLTMAAEMFSGFPRMETGAAPPRTQQAKEVIRKAYDFYGQMSDRQPRLKVQALMAQARQAIRNPDLLSKQELAALIEQLKKQDENARKLGWKEGLDTLVRDLGLQIK